MPRRDPLAVLARLRRLETDQARRLLAERLGRSAGAEARHEQASAAILEKAAAANRPGAAGSADYGLWLVRGLAERERATRLRDLAWQAEEEARNSLAEARAAERAVETLAAERARVAVRTARRAEQARLDDRAAARR